MSERKELQIYDCDYVMNTQIVQNPYIAWKALSYDRRSQRCGR